MAISKMNVQWRWRHFELFTVSEWHEILQLRAKIFVVEQNCPYVDPDHKDPLSWHLVGYGERGAERGRERNAERNEERNEERRGETNEGTRAGYAPVATLRAVPPGVSYEESSIGRVVVDQSRRGTQLGREMMLRGIDFNRRMWGGGIRISGQSYLERFYQSLGFETVGKPYLEDDIPHIEMLLSADTQVMGAS